LLLEYGCKNVSFLINYFYVIELNGCKEIKSNKFLTLRINPVVFVIEGFVGSNDV